MAEPRRLAFGVLPGRALCRCNRSFEGHLAMQVAQELGYADRLHRRQVRIETAAVERCRFVDRTRCNHLYKARVARGIEPLPRWHEQNGGKAVRR